MSDQLLEQALADQGFRKVGADVVPPEDTPALPPADKAASNPGENKDTPTPAPEDQNKSSLNKDTPAQGSAFDETKWLNEKFGDRFKSVDELVGFLTDAEQSKTKYSEIEQKYKNLENEFADAKPVNDYIKGLNKFVKDGGDAKLYHQLQELNLDNISDRDALVNQLIVKHGLSKSDAEFKVNRKYKIGSEGEVDETDPDVQEARIDLKLDAKDAREYLGKYKTDSLTPPAELQRKQAEAMQLERMNGWKNHTGELIKGLKQIELPYDNNEVIPFDVPPETVKELESYMQAVIENSQLQPDVDGLSTLKNLMREKLISSSLSSIAQTLISKRDSKWKDEVHHPSGAQPQADHSGTVKIDKDTAMAEFFAKADGYKYK